MRDAELPTREDVEKLPRWARMAFAARCARRALELHLKHHPEAPPKWVAEISSALDVIEGYARRGNDPTQAAEDARAAFDAADFAAGQAFIAANQAHFGADPKTHPAYATAQTLQAAADGLREEYYEADRAAIEARREAGTRAHETGFGWVPGTARETASAVRSAAEADSWRATQAVRHDVSERNRARRFSDLGVLKAARYAVDAGVSPGSVMADLRLLAGAAARGGWSDATPIPPTVFEPNDGPEAFSPWQEAFEAIRACVTPAPLGDVRRVEGATMRDRYPGEYVAYTEAADGRRDVLAHDRSLKAVHVALAHLTDTQIDTVKVTHCAAPATTFRGGYDGPHLTQEPPPRA